jgi:hypothetical protein
VGAVTLFGIERHRPGLRMLAEIDADPWSAATPNGASTTLPPTRPGGTTIRRSEYHRSPMRARNWFAVSLALLLLGIVGVAVGYPLGPTSDPPLVDVRFAPDGPPTGAILVAKAGPHTVWQAGGTRSDHSRCRVTAPDGKAVTLTASRMAVRWEPGWSDAVDAYAEVGTFDAAAPGEYGIACSVDPDAPGTSFVVTEKPGVVRSMVLFLGGLALLPAAVAVAVVTFVRRRRAHQPVRPAP